MGGVMDNKGALLASAVLGLLLALGSPIALAQLEVRGYARVLDGDTLDLQGVRIRLFGIDAPEATQTCTLASGESWPCGSAAREALERKLGNRRISCQRRDVDTYGRVVAVCRLGSEDVNGWLAGAGWVVAYRQFSDDYVDEEAAARRARLNLWQGSFELPADYRRRQKTGGGKTGGQRAGKRQPLPHQGQHQPQRRARVPRAGRRVLRTDCHHPDRR